MGFHKFDQLVLGKFDFPVQSDHKPLETCRFNVSRCRKSFNSVRPRSVYNPRIIEDVRFDA